MGRSHLDHLSRLDCLELPPNGQGIAALTMLNIMEQFPLGDMGTKREERCTL